MIRRSFWLQTIFCLTMIVALPGAMAQAQENGENGTEEHADKDNGGMDRNGNGKHGKKKGYERFLCEAAERATGLFDLIQIEKDYFFEIPDSMLGRDMLLGERVAELSSSSKVAAGEMRKEPIMVRFSRDDEQVYLHKVVRRYLSDESDPVTIAVERTSLDPIMHTFDIEALNGDSTAAVIDVTKFYSEEISYISPFNSKYKAGKLEAKPTHIIEALAFPGNMEVRTYMSYSNATRDPFSIVVHRSLLLLPEEPMRPRYEDPRIGYFSNSDAWFSTDTIGVGGKRYINRFDIRPRAEDMERYMSGELVEPENPVVFYVDDAFPKEWKKYVMAGIEDWQGPFEAIGFKNAVIAREYPKDDPTFHPEDIRYSCVRYISLPKANSMGPRWIDPRSGQVIGGDVLWWHNVVELLRDWRFVQTAAADPVARERNPGLDVLGPMIRYVTAHELGHVFGLKHNMRASYAYPVDSLRSPSFTAAYGTTPSIMDYARFNYIAQPGDGVEYFLPPVMGPYDYFAIKWGYQPIPEAESAKAEYETLNRWILEKSADPVYRFGDQQRNAPNMDPSSQNEALGDDAIIASTYGVKNLKYIMDHLVEWTEFENEDFSYLEHMYEQVQKQYYRYIGHVASYIGGVYKYLPVGGEETPFYTPVPASKQQQALDWLMTELFSQPGWLINAKVEQRIASKKLDVMKFQASQLDMIMNGAILQRLFLYHSEYAPGQYLDDLHRYMWEMTTGRTTLNAYERHLQATYVRNLLAMAEGKSNGPSGNNSPSDNLKSPSGSRTPAANNIIDPLIRAKVEEVAESLKKQQKAKDPVMRAHYRYLYSLVR